MSWFQETKLWLVASLGLPRDALHIYAGLIVFLGFAALFRLPLRDWRPLGATLFVALAGEAWDLFDARGGIGAPELAKSWHDLWNTMLWPCALFALARWTRVLKR